MHGTQMCRVREVRHWQRKGQRPFRGQFR